ncbi:MAG: diguanylate cyclase domain-containing protein [Candidatus Dormibacteria bacterium]
MALQRFRSDLSVHWWAATCGVAAVALALFILGLLTGGTGAYTYLDNIAETLAAFAAVAACALAARRHAGRIRLAWALMGLSALSWGMGQTVWDWYQVVRDVQVPFPSFADAGYLLAVPLAIAGVLSFPIAAERARTFVRTLLDGLLIAAGLFVVSWSTSLGAVYRAGAGTPLAMVLSLLYPISDVAIVTMILVRVGRVPRTGRTPLLFMAAGLAAAAIADSNFAYLTASNTYGTGNVLDAGWVAGYLLIALGALRTVQRPLHGRPPAVLPSRFGALLPYIPAAAAVGVTIAQRTTTGNIDQFTFWAVLTLVGLVLVRQYLMGIDNARLLGNLSARERELDHQANHDALTGLPNRKHFHECVTRTLERHRPTRTPCVVLFIDLDDFKSVNDTLGHAIGDRVLIAVAERLQASVRPGDMAARLGGDEFAILLERAPDRAQLQSISRRILQSLREPLYIGDAICSTRGTVGAAISERSTDTCDELLRRADIAMYAAKREGKDRVGMYSEVAA